MRFIIFQDLGDDDRKYADYYSVFPILAKLRHPLRVLVSNDLKECLDLVKDQRILVGVSPNNPYLFGTPNLVANNYGYFRASSVLNHIAHQSGVAHPERIKATELRKHVATYAAQMKLTDFEIAETARFLGHTERTHLGIYRQPLIVRDIVHISRFLEAALGEKKDKPSKDTSKQKTLQPSIQSSLDAGNHGTEHLDTAENNGKYKNILFTSKAKLQN